MKTLNYRFHNKMNEVFSVEPNDLGNKKLTFVYHKITGFLKKMPFIFILPTSFLVAVIIYFLFGFIAIKLVSILQYGF